VTAATLSDSTDVDKSVTSTVAGVKMVPRAEGLMAMDIVEVPIEFPERMLLVTDATSGLSDTNRTKEVMDIVLEGSPKPSRSTSALISVL